ncbi:ATP-dependent DNA helicase RecG [Nocardioides aequoreus]|uniref:ATP-dependent DNA helicase RecG n=1 Tax=Nocardioides aequoreus TaxID=397278 RepID=UPI0004C3F479|nr:ATP-dependent DNA helicase RecG [Nocardioides aequoreus]
MAEWVYWDSPVTTIEGRAGKQKISGVAGIETVGDLLMTLPRTYVRKGSLSELDELGEGDLVSLVGRITHSKQHTWIDKRTRRTAYRQEVVVATEGRTFKLVYFDRNAGTAAWRTRETAVGRFGVFSGKLRWFRDEWQLANPLSKMFGDDGTPEEQPPLIPIYPEHGKVTTWQFEDAVRLALTLVERVPEVLPPAVREAEDLTSLADALGGLHRPRTWAQLATAQQRVVFEEAFVAQVVLARRRAELARRTAVPRPHVEGGLLDAFDAVLPFTLTAGQQRVGEELAVELARPTPMHRLLQGEVGSGKTLVALRAMLQVVEAGGQAALLAPTEVLAQQHERSLRAMLGDLARGGELGMPAEATRLTLLTGSATAAVRRQALADAAGGDAGIVVGTHALLEERVQFADLGLVVVDEQHRFGVEQRSALAAKAGSPPHVLVMTATPIPRTVAMTVFGELDTSTLSELPAGRGEVQTSVVPTRARPEWLDRAWERVREEVAAGRQAYVVCSRIDPDLESEEAPLFAVDELAPELAEGALEGLRVEALHGRMGPEEKDAVMTAFAAGEVDVLVSTTVIEVGVDVPNATVMVVLDADRFGVSQLHQLRGRIGRGGHAGLCLLVSAAEPGGSSMSRLTAVAATRDGFELSRVDLEQRREGNLLGAQQSGGRGGGFRLLSVLKHEDVIARARELAAAHVGSDPELAADPDLAAAVAGLEESERADYLEKT